MFYRMAGGPGMMQVFPGEWGGYFGTASGISISPCDIPGNYYSHPEQYAFATIPTPWGFTEERRASLALYDAPGRSLCDPFSMVELA